MIKYYNIEYKYDYCTRPYIIIMEDDTKLLCTYHNDHYSSKFYGKILKFDSLDDNFDCNQKITIVCFETLSYGLNNFWDKIKNSLFDDNQIDIGYSKITVKKLNEIPNIELLSDKTPYSGFIIYDGYYGIILNDMNYMYHLNESKFNYYGLDIKKGYSDIETKIIAANNTYSGMIYSSKNNIIVLYIKY